MTQTQTHDLTFTATEVRKRYVSWDRGEVDREWVCLTLLAEQAPGVAPRPLRRAIDGDAPVVVMERARGTALGGVPLTPTQVTSLGAALRQLSPCRTRRSSMRGSPNGCTVPAPCRGT